MKTEYKNTCIDVVFHLKDGTVATYAVRDCVIEATNPGIDWTWTPIDIPVMPPYVLTFTGTIDRVSATTPQPKQSRLARWWKKVTNA